MGAELKVSESLFPSFFFSFETKTDDVWVIDTELKRRTRVTFLSFGFKMLITVAGCKATQVTLERIAFL